MFAHTSPFRPGPRFSRSIIGPLLRPTADTALIVGSAVDRLKRIYEEGYQLIKAGVILLDISDGTNQQSELGLGESSKDRSPIYGGLDKINMRYGRGTLHLASTGLEPDNASWGMKQERRTPRYTTNINEIPIARC